jgi:hypothetical protein
MSIFQTLLPREPSWIPTEMFTNIRSEKFALIFLLIAITSELTLILLIKKIIIVVDR